jgi:predicted flap endonuclease-1-like 5' DNA nuclease
MAKIMDIEGVGPAFAKKLDAAGVKTVGDLLKLGATPAGRKHLAEKSGIAETSILQWVNHADLFRIKGIGSEYSDLLEAAGVDTVVELATRKADNLVKKMEEVNVTKKLVRRLPTLKMVEEWVKQAKALPRIVTY